MTPDTIAAFALVVFAAYGLGAVAGYGGNILALPFLIPLLRNRDESISIVLLIGLFQAIHLGVRNRASIDRTAYRRMVVAAALGAPLGIYGAHILPERPSLVVLGTVVLLSGVLPLLRGLESAEARYGPLQTVSLWLGGVVQGAFAAGGGPIVAAARVMLPDRDAFRATLFAFWTTMNSLLSLTFAFTGRLTSASFGWFALALPFTLASGLAGQRLAARIEPERFRKFVCWLLVASGASTILRNL